MDHEIETQSNEKDDLKKGARFSFDLKPLLSSIIDNITPILIQNEFFKYKSPVRNPYPANKINQ